MTDLADKLRAEHPDWSDDEVARVEEETSLRNLAGPHSPPPPLPKRLPSA